MAAPARELAVCADPGNLPFSDLHGDGFENRIAELLAADLHAALRYEWNVQRRGFVRRGLGARACDVVMGLPPGLPGARTTRPYYTSTYVFVSRRDRALHLGDFDAPALRTLSIALPALGAEGANTPPAQSLALRGIVGQVVGFPVWGGADEANPAAAMVDAVATGRVDCAVLWGPIAAWYARAHGDALELTPAADDVRLPSLAYRYSIALGVRPGDAQLAAELQAALDRHRDEIRAILRAYAVPLVEGVDESPPAFVRSESSNREQ